MSKDISSAGAAEGGRRPTAAAPAGARLDRGRWSSARKLEVVLELLRGVSIDDLSRRHKVTASTIALWRDDFLAAGQAGLKSRPVDLSDEEIARLRSKVGEQTMVIELLEDKIDRLEANLPPALRRRT